jgi:alpha-mannosidase
LRHLSGRVNSAGARRGSSAAVVFNPHGWRRSDVVTTGRIYPVPSGARDVVVKDRSACVVPSQIVKRHNDPEGNLIVAEVAFLARDVPSVGYDTYYLEFSPQAAAPAASGLRVDEPKLILENEFVRVGLDPTSGGVASLVEKATGREMLSPAQGAFPHFTGRPNPNLSTRPNPPAFYDSGKSKAQVDWLAKGPLLATARAQHAWPYLKFETRVTLAAGLPYVEVVSRVLALVPPHSDSAPADIKEGYWFSLVPGFPATRVLRDFPFGVEETKNAAFHALTFVDLLGEDRGLLVLHPGTQYFKRGAAGAVSNLVMREWESHFTKEYGWPIYAEYRHALLPHDGKLTNADRLRAAAALARPLACAVGEPRQGDLPLSESFLNVMPGTVQLSAFRRKREGGYELRVVEMEGRRADAAVAINLPVSKAAETDLLGNKVCDAMLQNGRLPIAIEPWKIRTIQLD